MIARAQQQRNATVAQFDSLEFFVRRLEEYERTLSVLTTRIVVRTLKTFSFTKHLLIVSDIFWFYRTPLVYNEHVCLLIYCA